MFIDLLSIVMSFSDANSQINIYSCCNKFFEELSITRVNRGSFRPNLLKQDKYN